MVQLGPRRMDLQAFFLHLCQLLLTAPVRAPKSSLQALLLNTVLVSLLYENWFLRVRIKIGFAGRTWGEQVPQPFSTAAQKYPME